MDAPRLRPTFSVPLEMPREEAIQAIRERLDRSRARDCWQGKGRWCEIHIPREEQKIWSPHLSLRLDHEPDGCSVFGRFAPRAEVWTFFVFLYVGVGFLVLFGATLGYVQWASSEPAWGLWAVWLGVPFLGLLHLASWLGQRWSREQMSALKGVVDPILEDLRDEAQRWQARQAGVGGESDPGSPGGEGGPGSDTGGPAGAGHAGAGPAEGSLDAPPRPPEGPPPGRPREALP